MKISVRKAKKEDARFLAKMILLAGRAHVKKGIWEVVLNTEEKECLNFLEHICTTAPKHLFHYENYLIAENVEKASLGSLGGYSPKESGYSNLMEAIATVSQRFKISHNETRESEKRALKIMSCLPKEIPEAWVIDSVAITKEARGQGVAQKLMKEILKTGQSLKFKISQVSMYIGNTPALNLYQKFGFTVNEEKRNEYFQNKIGSPGMLSLKLTL